MQYSDIHPFRDFWHLSQQGSINRDLTAEECRSLLKRRPVTEWVDDGLAHEGWHLSADYLEGEECLVSLARAERKGYEAKKARDRERYRSKRQTDTDVAERLLAEAWERLRGHGSEA